MFVGSRDEAREFFLAVWRKMSHHEAMEPLEQVIAGVITEHPEYHATLADPERAVEGDFGGPGQAPNPFLHMGLHIALIEQLQTDRPPGIRALYQQLLAEARSERHQLEHRVMDVLGEVLWDASQSGVAPDQERYLAGVRSLLR